MADAFTPNYNFTLPEVGASRNTWGTKLNQNWTDIDLDLLDLENTKADLASPTFTGSPTFAGTTIPNLGSVTTVDLNGGTIDGTTIGATTPAAGSFTTLSSTGNSTFGGIVNVTGTLNADGDFTVDGDTTLGNASSDAITFNADAWSVPNGAVYTTGAVNPLFKIQRSSVDMFSFERATGNESQLYMYLNGTLKNFFRSNGLSYLAGGALAVGTTSASFSTGTMGVLTKDTSGSAFRAESASHAVELYCSTTESAVSTRTSIPLDFEVNTSKIARINTSGDFLFGTLVEPDGTANYGSAFTAETNSRRVLKQATSSTASNGLQQFFNPNGLVGSISTSGTTTSFNTTSDYRVKIDPQPLTGSGKFIDALQPKTWTWAQDGLQGTGFIAHEFQQVSPVSVSGEKDAVDEDGEPILQSMQASSSEVMANIIAELQSLRQRVAELESQQP